MQLGQLASHRSAQLSVEVGERLVKQEDARLADDCTAEGDTLLLTTGKRLRASVQQMLDVEDLGGLFDSSLDLFFSDLAQLQTERHVVEHGHMRVQSIVLEHHRDVSVFRGHVVHSLVFDEQLAVGNLLQTCDHTQRRRFAAAGRTDEDDELFVLDLQTEIGNGRNSARISLVNVLQKYACHYKPPDDRTKSCPSFTAIYNSKLLPRRKELICPKFHRLLYSICIISELDIAKTKPILGSAAFASRLRSAFGIRRAAAPGPAAGRRSPPARGR